MISAARGDIKPCTTRDCRGTMQFGREPMHASTGIGTVTAALGWVCSASSAHFTRTSGARDDAGRKAAGA